MKTCFSFALLLVLLVGAGCGSKSDDPAPGGGIGISTDPTVAILRTWKKTAFVIKTDKGDYNDTQNPTTIPQTFTFTNDGKYTGGTYSFKENNSKLVLVEAPSISSPLGFTTTNFITFLTKDLMELASPVVAVNPQKATVTAEEALIATVALNSLKAQSAIDAATVKSVQIVARYTAQ